MSVLRLPEEYYEVIRIVSQGVSLLNDVASRLNRDVSSLMRVIAELESRGLIRVYRGVEKIVELSRKGEEALTHGLPERKLVEVLGKLGPLKVSEIRDRAEMLNVRISRYELNIAISNLIKRNLCRIANGMIYLLKDANEILREVELREDVIRRLSGRAVRIGDLDERTREIVYELAERGLVSIRDRVVMRVELTDVCRDLLSRNLIVPSKVVTALSRKIIKDRLWREVVLKKFDLSVDVPTILNPVPHFMYEFINYLREIFVELGFEEVKGSPVVPEFWNFDVLFQAQDHPAREIHDTYYLKSPSRSNQIDEELARRVAETHESGWTTGSLGWGYKWSLERALRLVLRTQTTAVTAKALYERGEGEYRVFTVDRVFRPETLDPKHSMEFYQADGIVVGKNVRFGHLLGLLEVIARRLGVKKVTFKPAYFPFTCPSVEGYMWHEGLGWVEYVGAGVFRPEVTIPLGVRSCKVLAFGIGVDRVAMVVLGVDDIRELYTKSVDRLREYYSRVVKLRLV